MKFAKSAGGLVVSSICLEHMKDSVEQHELGSLSRKILGNVLAC